jgi:hypothetical protein
MDVGTAEPAETHTNGSAEALTHASLSFLQLAVQQERPPPGRAHTHASSTGQRDAAIVSHGTARGPQLLRWGGAHSTDSGLAVLRGSLARSLDAAAAGVSACRQVVYNMQPTSRRSVTHAAIAQHAKRLLGETSALYRYHSGNGNKPRHRAGPRGCAVSGLMAVRLHGCVCCTASDGGPAQRGAHPAASGREARRG